MVVIFKKKDRSASNEVNLSENKESFNFLNQAFGACLRPY